MSRMEERDYHARRATDELDLAYRARGRAAIEAHLRLSALHMARVGAMAGTGSRQRS